MANKVTITDEVQTKRVIALNKCMEAYDLRNVDLHNAGCGTPTEICDFRAGRRRLTNYIMERIYDNVFKEKGVRKDYLLGESEHMTYADELLTKADFENHVADGMWAIIEKALCQHNLSLKFVHPSDVHLDSFSRQFMNCWYEIRDSQDRLVKKIETKEMLAFENEIQDYVDFIISKRINNT